jgi:predicted RNA binding protein YcfA (HicA-like mRNA interferase family)
MAERTRPLNDRSPVRWPWPQVRSRRSPAGARRRCGACVRPRRGPQRWLAIADVVPFLKPQHFYEARHPYIYSAVAALFERAAAIDYRTCAPSGLVEGSAFASYAKVNTSQIDPVDIKSDIIAWTVTKRDKRIETMRRNPRQVTAEELHAALTGLGFTCRSGKGDHRVYVHADLTYPVIVDPNKPHLKRYIVLNALKAIDDLEEEED